MPGKYLLISEDAPEKVNAVVKKKVKTRENIVGRKLRADEIKAIEKRASQGDKWQSNKYYLYGEAK
jgi:hypothetical protein